MSRRDSSLEHIDITKLLIYVLVFLLVCMVMIFGFIVPNIKEYKASTRTSNSQLASYSKASHILEQKQAALNELKEQNKHAIEAFLHKFDTAEFVEFASQFFTDVALYEVDKKSKNIKNKAQDASKQDSQSPSFDDSPDKNQSDQDLANSYLIYELSVTSASDTPSRLYAFLDALAKYPNIIKVEFPIQMKGEGDKIRTRFNIKVYGEQ